MSRQPATTTQEPRARAALRAPARDPLVPRDRDLRACRPSSTSRRRTPRRSPSTRPSRRRATRPRRPAATSPASASAAARRSARASATSRRRPPIKGSRRSLFRCVIVNGVPRQTEDPLSPPCVSVFEGDNGGSTYKRRRPRRRSTSSTHAPCGTGRRTRSRRRAKGRRGARCGTDGRPRRPAVGERLRLHPRAEALLRVLQRRVPDVRTARAHVRVLRQLHDGRRRVRRLPGGLPPSGRRADDREVNPFAVSSRRRSPTPWTRTPKRWRRRAS